MDKKKVIELIEKGMLLQSKSSHVSAYKEKAKKCFNEALTELQKPDWISVEDELPPYKKKVIVHGNGIMTDDWFVAIRYPIDGKTPLDKNGFLSGLCVTHWRKIDKLEE